MTPDRTSRAPIDRRSFLRTAGAAGAAGATGLMGVRRGQAQAPEITLRFASLYPPAHSASRTAIRFGELVAAKTGGKVKVDLFHNAALGSEREAAEGVKSGSIDMAYSGLTGFGSYVPEFGVLEMPFLYDTLDQVKSVVDKISPQLEARMASVGLALLGYLYDGPRVTLSTKPLNSMDDFKGLKLRVPQIPLYVQMAQAFGATPDPGGAARGVHGAPVADRRGARGHADLAVHAEVSRGGEEPGAHRPHLLRRLHRHERAAPREAVARPAGGDPRRRPGGQRLQPRDRQAGGSGGLRPAGGRRRQDHHARTGRRSAPRSAPCARSTRRAWASGVSRSTTRSRP